MNGAGLKKSAALDHVRPTLGSFESVVFGKSQCQGCKNRCWGGTILCLFGQVSRSARSSCTPRRKSTKILLTIWFAPSCRISTTGRVCTNDVGRSQAPIAILFEEHKISNKQIEQSGCRTSHLGCKTFLYVGGVVNQDCRSIDLRAQTVAQTYRLWLACLVGRHCASREDAHANENLQVP